MLISEESFVSRFPLFNPPKKVTEGLLTQCLDMDEVITVADPGLQLRGWAVLIYLPFCYFFYFYPK